jgi:hypothetical protein
MKSWLTLAALFGIGWFVFKQTKSSIDPTLDHIVKQDADRERSIAANNASLAHRPAIAMIGLGPMSDFESSISTARAGTLGKLKFRPIAPGADTGIPADGLITIQPPFDPAASGRIQKLQVPR